MFEIIISILAICLLVTSIRLAFKITWGVAKIIATILMILAVPIFSVIIAVINEITEDKLRRKDLPVNTAEYYPENSLSESYDEDGESLGDKLSEGAGGIFLGVFDTLTGKNKKKKKVHKKVAEAKEADGDNTDTPAADTENATDSPAPEEQEIANK
jgi:hypothetical protein